MPKPDESTMPSSLIGELIFQCSWKQARTGSVPTRPGFLDLWFAFRLA